CRRSTRRRSRTAATTSPITPRSTRGSARWTTSTLVAGAHARGLKLLLDLVPCHTSIEHAWFRDHPERYIWSPVDGPPNNWRATFGGPAWSPDPHGRGWYLHSFYPQQPDL